MMKVAVFSITVLAGSMLAAEAFAGSVAQLNSSGVYPTLLKQKPIEKGAVDAMPRVKPQSGIAYFRINQHLAALDAQGRSLTKGCDDENGVSNKDIGSYSRHVAIRMAGPNYLTIAYKDDTYCGGPYPSSYDTFITYDLVLGKPVDWVDLLGPALGGKAEIDSKTGKATGSLLSASLFRLWLKARGPIKDTNEPKEEDECKNAFDREDGPLMVWADAALGGVAVQAQYVVHATAVCGSTAVIPFGVLKARGVSSFLIDSIKVGQSKVKKDSEFDDEK